VRRISYLHCRSILTFVKRRSGGARDRDKVAGGGEDNSISVSLCSGGGVRVRLLLL
jgi:hypothetical protein